MTHSAPCGWCDRLFDLTDPVRSFLSWCAECARWCCGNCAKRHAAEKCQIRGDSKGAA